MSETSDCSLLLKEIERVFDHQIRDYKVNSQGTGNTVIEINGSWIFRFPKSSLDRRQLEIEKIFLPKISAISPIALPKIEYEGGSFIGYRRIDGVPLTGDAYSKLSVTEKATVCASLGEFLSTLHSLPFEHENLVEFPLGDADFWKDIWEIVEPQLTEGTRQKALDYFRAHIKDTPSHATQKKDTPSHATQKVVCHGDFHPNHILFDPASGNITGIIDFGRISLSDPAVDFNLILRFYGSEALDEVLKHYSRDISEDFHERISFQNIRRLFSAIYFAENTDQHTSIARYIERIEHVFQ